MSEFAIANGRAGLERTFQRNKQLLRTFQSFSGAIEFYPAIADGGFDAELLLEGVEIARIIVEQLLRDAGVFEMKSLRWHGQTCLVMASRNWAARSVNACGTTVVLAMTAMKL